MPPSRPTQSPPHLHPLPRGGEEKENIPIPPGQRKTSKPTLSSIKKEKDQSFPLPTGGEGTGEGAKKKYRGGIDYETEWWGYRCGINNDSTIVIKDDEAWDKFRARFAMPANWQPEEEARDPRLKIPPPALPDVDFEKMMVIGVFLGRVQQGYRIQIYNMLNKDGKTLEVEYGKSLPLPNPMTGTSLTEPYHLKVIRRFDGKVTFWQTP